MVKSYDPIMIGIFLDSETSGLDPQKHVILEIAFQLINVSTGELLDRYEAIISHDRETWKRSNPTSLKINGLNWEIVQRGLPPEEVSAAIISMFKKHGIQRGKAVFICQNPSFDRAFFSQIIEAKTQEKLNWPYHWLDLASMYWSIALQDPSKPKPWRTGISKNKIAEIYHLPPEKYPHRAMNGTQHLVDCYRQVVGFPTSLY